MRPASTVKVVFALIVAFAASPIFAAINGDGLLNDVTNRFLTQSATWGGTITTYATWLFWVLATISMVWTFGLMALRKADIGEFFSEFVRFTITTGFFWWLLSNGPTMAMAIINSLRQIGATAGGIPNVLTPSTPISIGFDIVKKAFTGLSWVHPIDNLAIVLVSAAVIVCMAVVAANVLISLVTAWVMAYAGTFILGFGGARWTSDMAIGYFKAMLGIGLELMTMTLLIGITTSIIDGFYRDLDASSIYELLLVFCVCAVLALLISKIPGRVASLVGGGSGASVGAGSLMGAAAMGAAAAAAATAGAAVSAAMGAGATSMAGGAQALMAAFQKANAASSAVGGGADELMAAAGGAGGGGSGGSGGGGGGGGGGGSALASAMGDSGSGGGWSSADAASSVNSASISGGQSAASESGNAANSAMSASTASSGASAGLDATGGPSANADTDQGSAPAEVKSGGALAAAGAMASKVGKVAAGTAGNLAQGSWDVAKAKAASMKDAAMDRISETTGGKIAAAINARANAEAADKAPRPESFDDNSLSAGTEQSADAESEVAAFRDRNTQTS